MNPTNKTPDEQEDSPLPERSEQSQSVEQAGVSRRDFLRRGGRYALGATLGAGAVLLSGDKTAQGEDTKLDDLFSQESKDNEKKRDKEAGKQTQEEKEEEENSMMPKGFVGQLIRAGRELLQNKIAGGGGVKVGGVFTVNRAKEKVNRKFTTKLNRLESSARGANLETPDPAQVDAAIANLKSTSRDSLKNARKNQEVFRDVARVLDWLEWLYNRPEQLYPMNAMSQYGPQLARASIAFSNIDQLFNRKERNDHSKELADDDLEDVQAELSVKSAFVKTVISGANKKGEEGKNTAKEQEAQQEKNDAKAERNAERVEAKAERNAERVETKADKEAERTAAEERADKERAHREELAKITAENELKKIEAQAKAAEARETQAEVARAAREKAAVDLANAQQKEVGEENIFLEVRARIAAIDSKYINDHGIYGSTNLPTARLNELIAKHRGNT